MVKKLLVLMFLSMVLFNKSFVYAHIDTIEYIDIKIEIDENGDAEIIEKWNVVTAARSGYYKTFENMQNSQITSFVVEDEKGIVYEYLSDWNINLTPEEKINKCGINKTEKGFELCWGVKEEGFHSFTLKYSIKNFVHKYLDYQGAYCPLIPVQLNPKPTDFNINITLKDNIEDVILIGTKNINQNIQAGNVIIENTQTILKEESLSVLIKFPKDTFNTNSNIDLNFEDFKKQVVIYDKTLIMYIIAGIGIALLVVYLIYKIYKLK